MGRVDGPQIDLADRVRALLGDRVLFVRAEYERSHESSETSDEGTLPDLYREYYVDEYGAAPGNELLVAFDEMMASAGVTW
jgi:hypothetical protein